MCRLTALSPEKCSSTWSFSRPPFPPPQSLFPDHPESELLALLDAYADDLGAVVGWLMEEGDKLADDARAAQEVADQELARHMHVVGAHGCLMHVYAV